MAGNEVDLEGMTVAEIKTAYGVEVVLPRINPAQITSERKAFVAMSEKINAMDIDMGVENSFVCVLDANNCIKHVEHVGKGTVNSSTMHPRDVYRTALRYNGVSVIVAHNHPSGNLYPSARDIKTTQGLVDAGKLLGVDLLDHLIIHGDTFCSLKGKQVGGL